MSLREDSSAIDDLTLIAERNEINEESKIDYKDLISGVYKS